MNVDVEPFTNELTDNIITTDKTLQDVQKRSRTKQLQLYCRKIIIIIHDDFVSFSSKTFAWPSSGCAVRVFVPPSDVR